MGSKEESVREDAERARNYCLSKLLSKQDVESTIKGLKQCLEDVLDGQIPNPTFGLCSNLNNSYGVGISYVLVQWLSYEWPERVGVELCYPIDGSSFSNGPLYQGTALAKRISLLKYMIKRLHDLKRRRK